MNESGFALGEPLITLAADDAIYQREDRLCSGLREGVVVDFRGWEDEDRYRAAMAILVKEISGPAF